MPLSVEINFAPRRKQAHSIDCLKPNDMDLLLVGLRTGLRDDCPHPWSLECPHCGKCARLYLRNLPQHLRLHLGEYFLMKLKRNPSSPRSGKEMCATHSWLHPDLMCDILNVFRESEIVMAITVAELAEATNGAFADRRNLELMKPLKLLAEASIMWTGADKVSRAREWKKKYPGAMPGSQWRWQRNHCAACIFENALKSLELLSMVWLSLRIRMSTLAWTMARPPWSVDRAVTWVDCCFSLHSQFEKDVVIRNAKELHSWIRGQLGEPRFESRFGHVERFTEWNEYSKLVCRLQEEEKAAKLRDTSSFTVPGQTRDDEHDDTASFSGESERTVQSAEHHSVYADSDPALEGVLPHQYAVLESQPTPHGDAMPSIPRMGRNEDPSYSVSCLTSFLDDDALDGHLVSRKRGDMHRSGQVVNKPPHSRVTENVRPTMPSDQLDGTFTQSSEQSLASLHRWIREVNSETTSRGVNQMWEDDATDSSAASTTIDPTPCRLASELDYSGISEVGRRLESLIGQIDDDL